MVGSGKMLYCLAWKYDSFEVASTIDQPPTTNISMVCWEFSKVEPCGFCGIHVLQFSDYQLMISLATSGRHISKFERRPKMQPRTALSRILADGVLPGQTNWWVSCSGNMSGSTRITLWWHSHGAVVNNNACRSASLYVPDRPTHRPTDVSNLWIRSFAVCTCQFATGPEFSVKKLGTLQSNSNLIKTNAITQRQGFDFYE